MSEKDQLMLISYDKMKNQVNKELAKFLETQKNCSISDLPTVSFEKGISKISFAISQINERVLFNITLLTKSYLENVRIHSYGDGFYALQALNNNLFKTENILDNIKIELFGLSANFKAEISKKGNLSQEEINLTIAIYKSFFDQAKEDPAEKLKKIGASVFYDNNNYSWSYIAGYEPVKRKIRESIILPLKNPEIYDSIAKLTRIKYESNRPKAILFEGSPGVGKTTIARIIAGEVKVPLIYVPIESIMSKWYGQSSQNLSQIFDACEDLGDCILFIDEIDSLAGSRDQNMFEATRRILSVLLRRLDGIGSVSNTITIGATNRKHDLDHALISRFDQTILFPLPNEKERAAIFSNYAKHLDENSLQAIAKIGNGLSGRNIKDICEYTERRWVRKLIIKKLNPSVPPADYYKNSVANWMEEQAISV